ncbi:MAG: glycine zipper 2TM domain-containing protein [Gammaproteobacteria bacterium]
MNAMTRILIALSLGGVALAGAPAAHADRYVVNNYYGHAQSPVRYARHHDWRQDRPRHYRDDDDRFRAPRVEYRRHGRPVHERVIVEHIDYSYRPAPRYYAPPVQYRSATPTVLGGIIGGVIGNQMGHGRGKDAATIAGVILGGSIGRDIGYQQ